MFFFVVVPQKMREVIVLALRPSRKALMQSVPTGLNPTGFMIVLSGSMPPLGDGVVAVAVGDPPPPPPRLCLLGFLVRNTAATITMMTSTMIPPPTSSPRLPPVGLDGGPKPPPGAYPPVGVQPAGVPGWPGWTKPGWPGKRWAWAWYGCG